MTSQRMLETIIEDLNIVTTRIFYLRENLKDLSTAKIDKELAGILSIITKEKAV